VATWQILARAAVLALVGTAVAAVSASGPSAAVASDASCGGRAYTYAGLQEAGRSFGIHAAVTALTVPAVSAGHVAAWVGVGGVGEGPHGTSEWLQVGLSAFPGGQMSLYYEVALPGGVPVYTEIESQVAAGRPRTLAVLELGARPNWWRVWVDGQPRSAAVHLPASHGRWAPIAASESWNAGSRLCNDYRFRFAALGLANRPGGAWRAPRDHFVFNDSGYRLIAASRASFITVRSPAAPAVRRLVKVGG
jgi:hypothetical protein